MLIAVGVMLVVMEIILLGIGFSGEGEYFYKPRWMTRKKKAKEDTI